MTPVERSPLIGFPVSKDETPNDKFVDVRSVDIGNLTGSEFPEFPF